MSESMLSLISQVAQLEFELECSKARASFVAEYEKCAIWEYDIATKTLELMRKLGGRYSENDKTIKDYKNCMHKWNLIHPDDWAVFDAYCESMDNGDEYFSYDYRQVVNNALFVWVRNTGYTVYDDNGKPIKVLGKTLDISEEVKRKENLIKMAEFDSLTGLLNKQSFITNVKLYLEDSSNSSYGGSFYIIDIDDFKIINDTKGHMFGDEILRKVGLILKNVTPSNNFVSRIGGDEFCVFIKGKSTVTEAQQYANSIMEEISKIHLFDGKTLTSSIGISLYPLHSFDFDHLFDSADWALYAAKKAGKNCVEIYYPEEKDISDIASDSLSSFFGLISEIDSYDSSSDAIDLGTNSDKDRYSITQKVFANLNSTYYIIDNSSFEILDYSRNIQRVIPYLNEKGRCCYEKLAGRSEPCLNCPAINVLSNSLDSSKIIQYRSKYGKILRIQAKLLDNERTLIAIQDVSKYSEVNARFNQGIGVLTLQLFLNSIDNALSQNIPFNVCLYTLSDIENVNNKTEYIKSLARGIKRQVCDNEPVCLINDDIVACLLYRDRAETKVFSSATLITYNAYYNTNKTDDNEFYRAYGAIYIPRDGENADTIMNNALECLKEAYNRRHNDDHYYLISNRM